MDLTFRSDIHAPQDTTPERPAPSVRRTSHIDMRFEGTVLHLAGAARDLVSFAGGQRVHATGTLRATVDARHLLRELVTEPPLPHPEALTGLLVGHGFRAAVAGAAPDDAAGSTPLFLLLDELPVAAMISGYALMYTDSLQGDRRAGGMLKADVCSGWRSDGTMMTSITRHGRIPVPMGPAAPALEREDDPTGWHAIPRLGEGTMRRRRLLEVSRAQHLHVFATFRDTHVGPDGVESVLHEYSLTARVDESTGTLHDCVAVPRVLPWNECPDAAASAPRLDGRPLDTIRDLVRRELRGVGTCTHLNDLLRSLGDLSALAPLLPR